MNPSSAPPPGRGSRIAPVHVGKRIPPPYAGIEAHIDTLLRCLDKDVDATLVATAGHDPHEAARHPYRVIAAPVRGGAIASVPFSPGIVTAVRAELNSGRANLLHLHAPNPWGDLAGLMAGAEVPVVMTWHSDIVRQRRLMRVYASVQRRILRRADRIVVFTPKHYESSTQLRDAGIEAKLVTIHPGFDFARFDEQKPSPPALAAVESWCDGRPMILTVGRHIYYKGYEHLIDAMAKLRSDAVLVMVGTGPLSDALTTRAEGLGIAARVRLLGEVDNEALIALMKRCDIFTLPSVEPSEAFGIATAEAKACGKPAVVCELGNGVNYLTRHGTTGLAVPPRDSAALADALDTLVLDGALRQSMGAAASTWVRTEFSLERMRRDTLAMYRSLV